MGQHLRVAEALTVLEAAQWLGISVRTLRSRIAAGELRASKVDGLESVLVDDLNTWLEASRVKPGDLSWSRQVRDPDTGRWSWGGVRAGDRTPIVSGEVRDDGVRASPPTPSTSP